MLLALVLGSGFAGGLERTSSATAAVGVSPNESHAHHLLAVTDTSGTEAGQSLLGRDSDWTDLADRLVNGESGASSALLTGAGTDSTTDEAVSAALLEGVPLCTDHNSTTWHPLVKRDANDKITCTYGHEHHDDPKELNDLFGPPSAWYGGSQQISYPWQTQVSLGAENVAKHQGYKWFTRARPALHAA